MPAAHTPAPPHALQGPQPQSALHMRVCVPQLPQRCISEVPGAHVPISTPHARHIPPTHVPPDAHALAPGQHICPGIPQPVHRPL